ncbi:MAG: glycosyltransferase [Candidatus Omnitrophica bacterium]|nr:glycosyltransferase [Candidatus Omnitrophota bacterium]
MKVIFVTRENSQMPAVRVRCYNFAKYLEKAGICTEVFSYADMLGAKSGKDEKHMSWFWKIYYNLQAYRRLSCEDAIFIIQRVNYHSFAPLFLGIFKKRKLILDLDDWEAREDISYYFNRIPSSKAEIMMRFIAKRSVLCIGASRFLIRFLSCYSNKVLYIPTTVDTDVFKPDKKPRQKSGLILSWLGTMYRNDNVENINFLIECFKALADDYPQLKLEIRGDGTFYEQVYDLVEKCNPKRVLLKPWISPQNVAQYLEEIDIGVMPLIQNSKFNKSKSPTRLFEYMAMEKPVVVSAVGEANEIIIDGFNGLLADNKADFINKLRTLIEDRDLRENLGKNARETIISKYRIEKLTQSLVKAIKSL